MSAPDNGIMSASSLFDGYNGGYVQELYERFARNPESVSPPWQRIFSQELSQLVGEGLIVPDALREGGGESVVDVSGTEPQAGSVAIEVPADRMVQVDSHLLPKIARATALIEAFRDHGHQLAGIDPLGGEPPGHPELDPAFFGTSIRDLEEIPTSLILSDGGAQPVSDTLREFRKIYCGSIGYQFEHLEDPEKVRWLWGEVESGSHSQALTTDQKLGILHRLTQVEGLERFLHRSYLGQKRFSIEGTDMLVPMLDLALAEGARDGADRVILGMSHRGRLNVLAHILGVGYRAILREFEEAPQEGAFGLAPGSAGTGDVKYHLGASGSYPLSDGMQIHVSLAPNPSHLEFVDAVVVGMTRALQQSGPGKDDPRDASKVLPILIHGDAAFAAEGVVAETLNLARLDGYSVGGTVHIIVNNQVGFTTDPSEGRSTRYASDLAKGYDIPILHVNADDPEACLAAVRLSMAYRAAYRDDVLIDLVGYRRYGHNEGDEPSYTQPLLYRKIDDHPTVRAQWAARLISEGILSEEGASEREERVYETLLSTQREAQEAVAENDEAQAPQPPPPNEGFSATAVSFADLARSNREALAVPDSFAVHPKLERQLERRRANFREDTRLDWGHAESLALATVLSDGVPIRFSGQDTARGTFSQRHLVLHDVENGARATPLETAGSARFEIYNSPLSEAGALGFEYGYSVAATSVLVLWEAQFGDFVNAAQVIVDQFIASGRTKWNQESGLTLLLPHGHEGQGPEHSSARLERFLQLCAENNMIIAYPTTPAQYFHLLRRQALRSTARPMVIMTPKSLLRHPGATSSVRELVTGGFRPVLPDGEAPGSPEEVTRLILCSGKIYYDLATAEGREDLRQVAIGRIERLYGFPDEEVRHLTGEYPNLQEVVWAQEEPQNMGALGYIGPHLRRVIPREIALRPVARPERSSPAEGRHKTHRSTQVRIVQEALGLY